MIRSAASKVMWVGRATVFLVGLAVILALVFGAATTALGASGASLILGKPNAAETPTHLVSTLTDAIKPALNVNNKSGGPALNLGVARDQAPIKVNAAAGTATNLSADELDNKSSDELVRSGQGFDRTFNSGQTFTSRTSATVDAPADGFVILNGTVIASTSSSTCNPCYAHAHIFNTTSDQKSTDQLVSIGNGTSAEIDDVVPISWVFPVDAGGNTFELRTALGRSDAPIGFYNPTLTALYVPYGADGASALASASKLASPTGEQREESPGGTLIKK